MTKRSRLLYMFFYRLPIFVILLALFHILVYLLYPDWAYQGFSWLMVLPHAVFFLIKEASNKNRASAFMQIAAFIAICGVIYLLSFDYLSMWLLIGFLFALLIYSLRARVIYYERGYANGALALNALMAVFYALIDLERNKTVFYISLANIIVILLCRSITQYYANQEFLIHSRWWKHQPKTVALRVLRKSSRLMYVFVAAFGLLMIIGITQTVNVEIIFSSSPSNDYEAEVTPEVVPEYLQYLETEAPPEQTPEPEITPDYWYDIDYESINWHIPDEVKIGLIIASVVIVIVLCIVFYMRFQSDDTENEGTEDLIEDEAHNRSIRLRASKGKLPSTNQAVRTLFRRKVNDYRKQGLPVKTADTARRLSDEISGKEDLLGLDGLYHAARYSGETVVKGDLADYKKRIRDKRKQD